MRVDEEWVKNYKFRRADTFKNPTKKMPATPTSRYKNKWEEAYAAHLALLLHVGDISWWGYECWGFRLADNTFHYPDFPMVWADGHIEIHDVKGRKREVWAIKFKICKEMYPWIKWRYVKRVKGEWKVFEA